ncbi:NAD-dependent epimerase/dehydratase family protein [Phytoactinopolyspora mesophila]|uniref:NAD-dependent epimerase/dehydratase family protein n=1 Tax=Phytoactinopolyspora mesophila TaxID=2650750 RepID=A0A7K3M4Y3_9ACTN|nr:NAD-dependent epimerase/dehydratase family protein [Phytoactinopolyspora mesophila]NDL58306.1 NAD-dependent epimerase/dehydratase family protein [Phytoactinopolyspora mesophila]
MSFHVIVGAGAVGSTLATELADSGHEVRLVTRSGSGPAHPHIRLIRADAADRSALLPHVTGAAALYNCANPPTYALWERSWPPLAASMLSVAESTGAVLVTMSNLYGYGPVEGPISRDHPLTPSDHKGMLRARMWQDALAAHEAGRVRVTEARASDFIGPGVGPNGGLITRYGLAAVAGKPVYMFGDPDAPHSWTYMPDVARTLAVLGTDERAWGRPWHVPTAPPVSARAVVEQAVQLAGARAPRVRRVRRGMLRPFYPFSALLRELDGVLYQFKQPWEIDSTATSDDLGLYPTPWDITLESTVDHWRHAHYQQGSGQKSKTS